MAKSALRSRRISGEATVALRGLKYASKSLGWSFVNGATGGLVGGKQINKNRAQADGLFKTYQGMIARRKALGVLDRVKSGGSAAVPGLKRAGRRADAGSGARLALAKAAATRTAAATRSTSVMGLRTRKVAAVTPSGGNGQVKAYTRTQNGQAVFVGGYTRQG